MVTMEELLNHKYKLEDQSEEIQANLAVLLDKVNQVRSLYGKPMTVSSGLRTIEDHLRIYAAKGITDQSKIPMKSHHLYGEACDISDPKQELQKWCLANIDKLEEIGLWMEDFHATENWVHFQIIPYGSFIKGKSRFFKP